MSVNMSQVNRRLNGSVKCLYNHLFSKLQCSLKQTVSHLNSLDCLDLISHIKRPSSHPLLEDSEIIQKLQCHLGIYPCHKNAFLCIIYHFLLFQTPMLREISKKNFPKKTHVPH